MAKKRHKQAIYRLGRDTEHTAGVQKVKKVSKKVLTFGCQNDILIKLTRERAGERKAKDLEN